MARNRSLAAKTAAGALALALFSWPLLSSPRRQESVRTEPPADRHAPCNFVGRQGMVVAAHPLAVEAGLNMLKGGGNAVDAAVATAFALNAAEPFASGIGGGGFMVIYLAQKKRTTVINFREEAPGRATLTMFKEKGEAEQEWRTSTGLAVAVPGSLAGWDLALRKYGTRSLAEVSAKAIGIAEEGFAVSPTFSSINKDEYEKLAKNAGEETCYLKDGFPYEPGEFFRNPELARTIRLIAANGVGEFYRGELARKIVAAAQAKGGILSLEDLAAYEAVEVAPLSGSYKGDVIMTAPPPASGGLHLLQFLNVVENWPVKSWGRNSPGYIHHLSEALRIIFADREKYVGDPEFISIPIQEMLAKNYAAGIASRIQPDRSSNSYPYGKFTEKERKKGNTTHLCVMDKEGNVVALTQSINDFFGTGIVPAGTGFLLNDHMDDFAQDPRSVNAPAPGRRPVSSMGPLIMFKDGRPYLVLGSPGGTRIFSSLAQIILNVTEFGMALDEAIEAPRFFSYSEGGQARPIFVESRIPEQTSIMLRQLGHEVEVREAFDKYFGGAQGILALFEKKIIYGGADSRRDGWGAGY